MKKVINDLAFFGGHPLFESVRPIGQLAAGDISSFFEYARKMYSCRRLTNNGPLVNELEYRLARLHEVEFCISFCSASIALVILMEVLANKRSGKVLIPAFTYPGLPHLVQWAGLYPCFCDIDPQTHTLAPNDIRTKIDKETIAVLGVHQVNSSCHIDEIQEICDDLRVELIFDSVHGVGATYKGSPLGRFGRAEVFSLHATKIINGFEGGYVTTNDKELAEALRLKRNFGFSQKDAVSTLGMNGKLNEIHAALALASLADLRKIISGNKKRYELYRSYFDTIPGCMILPYPDGEMFNYEFAILDILPDWKLHRDRIVQLLRHENALARPYYSPPLHLSQHKPRNMRTPSLPISEQLAARYIQMPVGELVDHDTIERLAALVAFIRENDHDINERMIR